MNIQKFSLLLTAFIACACGGDDKSTSTAVEVSCEADSALLGDESSCLLDEDCPCGAHCDLGLCTAACASDGDCDTGSCDAFGRCVEEPGIPRVAGAAIGPVRIEPSALSVSGETDGRLYLRGDERSTGPIRAVADDVLEVSCNGGDFATSCLLASLEPDDPLPRRVAVRLKDGVPTGLESAQVRIFSGQGFRSVNVSLVDNVLAADPPACASVPPGLYTGTARITGQGVRGRTIVEPLQGAVDELRVPLTAKVYVGAGSQRVVFRDERGILFGESGAIGDTLLQGASRTIDLVSTELLSGVGPDGALEIGVGPESEEWRCLGERLEGEMRLYYLGSTQRDSEPFLRWQINLTRESDLAADDSAPALPTPWTANAGLSASESIQNLSETAFAIEADAALRIGSLGATPAARAQAAACNNGLNVEQGISGDVSTAGQTSDLMCNGAVDQQVYQVLRQTVLAVDDVVESCMTDLERFATGVDGASAGCLDVGRALLATSEGLAADRARAFGTSVSASLIGTSLAHRQLQQWLGAATFTVQEAEKINRLNKIVDQASQASQTYSVLDALSSSRNSAALLLHPRVAVPLTAAPPEVLAQPDYRLRLFPSLATSLNVARTENQNVGISVEMLRTQSTQLRVLESLLVDVQYARGNLADVDSEFSASLRQALPTMALANAHYSTTRTVGEPDWQAEWDSAQSDAISAVIDVYAQYDRASNGKNPLGIEDGDLPLYRIGDQEGALDRFSALSDFLLGEPGSSTAVAPAMVSRSEAALASARQSYVQTLQRDLNAEFQDLAQDRRINAVADSYGEPIVSLCGDPTWETGTVLDAVPNIDAETCYLSSTCRPSLDEQVGYLDAGRLGYAVCILAQNRVAFGHSFTSGDREIDALADAMPTTPPPLTIEGAAVNGSQIQATVHWGNTRFTIVPSDLKPTGNLPSGASAALLSRIESGCENLRSRTDSLRPGTQVGTCTTAQDCPVGARCSAGTCTPLTQADQNLDPACYQGSLGEMALGLRSAQQEIEIARSELAEFTESYDIAMRTCIITQKANDQKAEALTRHNDTMSELGKAKLAMDIAANFAAATKDGSDGALLSGGASAAAAFAEAGLKSASDTLAFKMEEADRRHQAAVANIDANTAEAVCFNDAELHLVGARTVALQVQQVQIDLTRTAVEMNNAKRDLRRLVDEGRATLASVRDLRLPAIAGNYWLDENISDYDSLLRQSKRAVYLAVLASEYEYQFSSVEKANTLAANTPTELLAVMDRLRSFTATGTVGGSSPSELVQVVSLRAQLLQLGDRSEFPAGYYDLSEKDRFRLLVNADHFAVYSDDGSYLGQEIPFTIAPLSRFELGQGLGIPILSGSDCAERLWSVNASLVGETLHTSDTSLTRVTLKKRNTFFSQWCGTAGPDGSDLQFASTRPARNLFLDPLAFADSAIPAVPIPDASTIDETRGYSNARIQARLNVSRAELESESFADGDSQELAGRGLYGEYALFIPAETLSIDGSEGLLLANVEDILLRLDYISVAR